MEQATLETKRAQTQRACALMSCSTGDGTNTGPQRSHLGGVPYAPRNWEAPKDSAGEEMAALAQVNLADLAPLGAVGLDGLPTTGILQFWVSRSVGVTGMCWGAGEKAFEPVFWPDPDPALQDPHAASLACEPGGNWPHRAPIACSFTAGTRTWNGVDESFDAQAEGWTDEEVEGLFELPDEEPAPFHGMGGWAHFTQSDPRPCMEGGPWLLLWQADSDDGAGLLWGDCGVANAFILEADLKAGRFDRIRWNWDCC